MKSRRDIGAGGGARLRSDQKPSELVIDKASASVDCSSNNRRSRVDRDY